MKIYLVSAIKEEHQMDAKFYGENFSDVEKQFTGIHTDWVITEIRLVGFIHEGVTYKFCLLWRREKRFWQLLKR